MPLAANIIIKDPKVTVVLLCPVILCRLYQVCKDFCGVLNEESVKRNNILVLEILDEMIVSRNLLPCSMHSDLLSSLLYLNFSGLWISARMLNTKVETLHFE